MSSESDVEAAAGEDSDRFETDIDPVGKEEYPDWVVDTVEELDPMSRDILVAIHQHNGVADTTEIRKHTGIENGYNIHYRYEGALEDGADPTLVETHKPERTDLSPQPAKVGRLTDAGGLVAQYIEEYVHQDDLATEERLGRIESVINAMRDRLVDVEDQTAVVEDLEHQLDTLEREVADIDDAVEAVFRYLEDVHDADLDPYYPELDEGEDADEATPADGDDAEAGGTGGQGETVETETDRRRGRRGRR